MSTPLERLRDKTTTEVLWIYILRLLSEKALYAYELSAALKKRFGFESAKITSYVVLYRLESAGYVRSKWEGGKKYYHMTSEGKKLLQDGRKYLKELAKSVD